MVKDMPRQCAHVKTGCCSECRHPRTYHRRFYSRLPLVGKPREPFYTQDHLKGEQ